MGVSTHLVAFKEPSEQYKKYRKIYDACKEAGVRIPDEVNKFFRYDPPPDEGLGEEVDLMGHPSCKEYRLRDGGGWEIDVSKLPAGTKVLRFYQMC